MEMTGVYLSFIYSTKMSGIKVIKVWMWIGMVMIFFQIVLGGITRLTGSGLSITKWEIVTGTLPPMNQEEWIDEFNLYKETPQYKKINEGMSMEEFKMIYFWEFVHRLWARSMGFVFLIPFLFFLFKGWLSKSLKIDLFVVFILAGFVGLFGWVMVASGLIDRPWVNAYKLSVHLGLALITMSYLLYTILKNADYSVFPVVRGKWPFVLFILICIQILLGAMMSGMKAALVYPSFPMMNQFFIDPIIFNLDLWRLESFVHYDKSSFLPALVQFLHRSTAFGIVVVFLYAAKNFFTNLWIRSLAVVILVQILLGVTTLVLSKARIPLFWGVLHQAMGILCLLLCLKWVLDIKLKHSS